jgi:hypothetical protein
MHIHHEKDANQLSLFDFSDEDEEKQGTRISFL